MLWCILWVSGESGPTHAKLKLKMNLRSHILIALAIGQLLVACQSGSGNPEPGLNGHWIQQGYGNLVTITDSMIIVYEGTSRSCFPDMEIERSYLTAFGEITEITEASFTLRDGITDYQFLRVDSIPLACQPLDEETRYDPEFNFEVAWHTFNDQYAYFGVRAIDWQAVYDTFRPRVSAETSDLELYLLLEEMIGLLNDGHVTLEPGEDILAQAQDQSNSGGEELLSFAPIREAVIKRYVKSPKYHHQGLLRWGPINDQVGYIQLNGMLGFADFGIRDDRRFWDKYWDAADATTENLTSLEQEGVRVIMDSVLSDFEEIEAIVLDLRFNGGGMDAVAMEILNHFAKSEGIAFTKKARMGSGFTPIQEIPLQPAEKTFDKDVFVLTSGFTASAAEVLTLATQAVPGIQLIGSPTSGEFSDMLERSLPNGWTLTLSNEVYESIGGKSFEMIGIPPDHSLGYSRDRNTFISSILDELPKGDPAIEFALLQVQGN